MELRQVLLSLLLFLLAISVVESNPSLSPQGGRFLRQLRAFDENNCRCGWKNEAAVKARIVNGTEVDINEYPLMVGLYHDIVQLIFCGATIITDKYIVTAAHCVTNPPIDIKVVKVFVGEHDQTTEAETSVTKSFRIKDCKTHPNYRTTINLAEINDVAVCEIDGTIDFDNTVGPACLPFQSKEEFHDGSTVTALGWGFTEAGSRSDVLLEVDLHVISNERCAKVMDEIIGKELCTLEVNKDSCKGDSGGPVLWQNPETQNYVLVGITSYGPTKCASRNVPAVNMHVGSYLDWIVSETPGAQYCKVE